MGNKTRASQEVIFRELFNQHKGTTMAVSSESPAHKALRYELITDTLKNDDGFSVHDVGMGLADLLNFMKMRFPAKNFSYSGSDILIEYVEESRRRYPGIIFFHRDIADCIPDDCYDWVVMSGVFHQRKESTIREWEHFAHQLIKNSFAMARKGVVFNFISPFVDYYQTEVYYSNMPKWINFINDELSRFFVIRHDYALFEYTVSVFKPEYVQVNYSQPEFEKYFANNC